MRGDKMNKQIQAVRQDGIKKDSVLKDNNSSDENKMELIKVEEYKDFVHGYNCYRKYWQAENGKIWVSYHRDCNFDEDLKKYAI